MEAADGVLQSLVVELAPGAGPLCVKDEVCWQVGRRTGNHWDRKALPKSLPKRREIPLGPTQKLLRR